MKLDILAFGAHPDDVELSCSGTLLKHIDKGRTVGLIDLTEGELGTRGTVQSRYEEANKSQQLMGAKVRENLQLGDGFFEVNNKALLKVIEMIRKYQPEIILANAKSDRHPDHGRGAQLLERACFLSGLRKIETQVASQIQEPWRPKALYHYIQDRNLVADFVVDTSEYMERKMELILCFETQFYKSKSGEPETPISSKAFLNYIKEKDAVNARQIGAKYAEGFNVNRQIGVNDLFDLI